MAASQKKRLALDTNLLLDLAAGGDFAHEFREEFQGHGYALLLPPTVVAELELLADVGAERRSGLARAALAKLSAWGCHAVALSSTELAIAQQFGLRLLARQLIPDEERNDGKILAQASLAEIPLLVTSDKHLLNIDEEALLLAFQEADLFPVHPVHPRRLLRALR
jgi:predicted nucleic acid-binding protein